MVAYSFHARFAEPIILGTKGGTIRAPRSMTRFIPGGYTQRKRPHGHALPGEELQLYAGMRTKHCRLIARKTCLAVEPIDLDFSRSLVFFGAAAPYRLLAGDTALDALARFDGFSDFVELAKFWQPKPAFAGWHIRWLPLPAVFADG